MLEIVFSESAAGSMSCARSFGRDYFIGGSSGVALPHRDGSKPPPEEQGEARREAEGNDRSARETAVPFEPGEVLPFSLGLNLGPIADAAPADAPAYHRVLQKL